MGHDLDQVISAAPGALATLRQQRDALNRQIDALELIVAEHEKATLVYNVTRNGNVEDVRPVEINVSTSTREKVLEALKTMREPMRVPDICELTDIDSAGAARAMLATLVHEGQVRRVERGVYQLVIA